MRALLITVGSRGDAEPFCALAETLATAGHDVDLWMQSEHHGLLASSSSSCSDKITLAELPFSTMDFYKFVGNPNPAHDHPNPRVKFTGVICDCVGHLVLPCTTQVLDSCEQTGKKPSVVVASSLARHLGMALVSRLDVPLCLVQLQPLVPTRDFPHYSKTTDSVQAILNGVQGDDNANAADNLQTYWELETFMYKFINEHWEVVYKELGIDDQFPTFDDMKQVLEGNKDNVVLVNAFSDKVIPICSDHDKSNIWNVGAFADDYLPADWKPPQELVDFLEAGNGTKSVCVGYGSMPFDKTQMILDALEQTNERAILVGSAMVNAKMNDSNQILAIRSVPYSYLLPMCSMMLSHGGAGVIQATLRAGIPSVVSPLMGDQFFWAQLLEEKGLGVVAGSLPHLSVDTLVGSIEAAKSCDETCATLGKAIHEQESGAKQMVRMLEEKFGP